MSIQWKGIMPAVTTKFTDNDELDLKTFELNINAQLEAGVHGIVLGGTLGEASTLLDEEKRLLTTTTVDIVKGKVPVLINIAEQTTKGAILAVQKAEEDGDLNRFAGAKINQGLAIAKAHVLQRHTSFKRIEERRIKNFQKEIMRQRLSIILKSVYCPTP